MRNYSICYLDARGHTQSSEFLPFEDNGTAVDFARIGLIRSDIVEIWRDSDLVDRLFRDPLPYASSAEVADNAARAIARADRRGSLDSWDNEGGAARPREGARH
jgi:hypothetical protein